MKSFIAFAAIVAVATSAVLKPVGNIASDLEAIVAAINSPSTDPATAALLEQQLQDLVGGIAVGPAIVDEFAPIAVGPAIVEEQSPISVGPAFIDFPVPDGGAVTAVEPTPIAVAPVQDASTSSAPLVQIILNINAAQPGAVAVTPELVSVPEAPKPDPVSVVDVAEVQEIPATPVTVVDSAPEPVLPEPVLVAVPIIPEPIQVAEPILPAPAVVLPDILN